MKRHFLKLAPLALLALTGCGSPKPYTIYDQKFTSYQATSWVDVPADATDEQMAQWGKEIAQDRQGANGIFITFYKGGHDANHLVGQYSDTSGFSKD